MKKLGFVVFGIAIFALFVFASQTLASGNLATWRSTNAPAAPISNMGSATYNGYVYTVGGQDVLAGHATNATLLSHIDGDGTLSAWGSTTPLPQRIAGNSAFAYNGHIYSIGGNNALGYSSPAAYTAAINGNGTLGAWTTSASAVLPVAMSSQVTAVYNGFVYVIGGVNNINGPSTLNSVYSSAINADGTLAGWSRIKTTPSPVASAGAVAYNGYLYLVGGFDRHGYSTSSVYSAPIHNDGTLGVWAAVKPLPSAVQSSEVFVHGGILYSVGGFNANGGGGPVSAIYAAQTNSDGTLGSWATLSYPNGTNTSGLGVIATDSTLYLIGLPPTGIVSLAYMTSF